jgi:glycosyltransferase involved in cell wall biosynthesis
VPIVVQDRAGAPPDGRRLPLRLVHRWANAKINGVIFTARDQAAPWHEALALPRRVPVFEAIPMSSAFMPGDQQAARSATGMHGDPCLLSVARLDANKDPLTILSAVESAVGQLPNVRLYCCFSDALLLSAVRQRIASSERLRDRVELLGARDHAELELRYRAADFLVQASHHEGSGYSVIEAMSCGVIPIVTDIPSFRNMIGAAGSLTPVEDADAMARAIITWSARDRAQCRAMARAHFERTLSFDVVGQQLVGICARLAAA